MSELEHPLKGTRVRVLAVSGLEEKKIAPDEPAATVILLRDAGDGVETLMLKRNSKLNFAGGLWVFPGGRVDEEDKAGLANDDDCGAARVCAAREAQEEAALAVQSSLLIPFSHWTPPDQSPRRFLTWFFLAAAPKGKVTVDQGEIHDHRWVTPADALRRIRENDIQVLPPTLVTLSEIDGFASTADTLAHFKTAATEFYRTRIGLGPLGATALWHGDAGYEDNDPSLEGPLHRVVMAEGQWRYERDEATRP